MPCRQDTWLPRATANTSQHRWHGQAPNLVRFTNLGDGPVHARNKKQAHSALDKKHSNHRGGFVSSLRDQLSRDGMDVISTVVDEEDARFGAWLD